MGADLEVRPQRALLPGDRRDRRILGRVDYEGSLSGLLSPIIVMLAIAVRNTWDLLVTVVDRPENGSTHQPR